MSADEKYKANIEAICEEITNNLWQDSEWAEYIMDHCGGDRIICNGNTLVLAMEDSYLLDDFAAIVLDKIENGELIAPKTLVLIH